VPLADPLEVFENAAVELVDLLQPFLTYQQRGLLAADAAGAVADDGMSRQLGAALAQALREFGELRQPPVQRAAEAAMIDLEGIARVEQQPV
jgi:hypothetical protein